MYEELVRKFIEGKCTEKETIQLLRYFKENPLETERYFSEEEWIHFYQENKNHINQHKSERLLGNIETLILTDQSKRSRTRLWVGAAAASLMLCFIGYWFFQNRKHIPNIPQQTAAKNKTLIRENTTDNTISITLPDSSVVSLYTNSKIHFDSIFEGERNIKLYGKAAFDAAPDTAKAFSVVCNGIITKALGTKFMIDGLAEHVRIDLYQGKVSVSKEQDAKQILYLQPGQYALFNSITHELTLGKPAGMPIKTSTPIVSKKQVQDKPTPGMISFRNNNLKNVLDRLSVKYNVAIEYPTEKVSRINMNILVDTSHNIDAILRNVAAAANLKLIKADDGRFILK